MPGPEKRNDRHLSMPELLEKIHTGEIDTVVVAFTDMQGRLQGKRLHGRYFTDVVVEHGTEGCNYLLAVDVDMNTVGGYSISSWERGYGDMEFVLDERTIRLLTHLPATAMVQCDLVWLDHSPVLQSPRAILQKQLDRAAEYGWQALAGTELEFIAFDTTYEAAARPRSTGTSRRSTSTTSTTRSSAPAGSSRCSGRSATRCTTPAWTSRAPRASATSASTRSAFLYADALTTADNHSVYKTVAKEIAAHQGRSITFMAKYNEREGSSCHIHLSLRGADGSLVFWDADQEDRTPLYDHFVAGLLATMADFTLLLRAEHQLLQAVRQGLVRTDRDRLGTRQPDLRGPPGRPRRRGPPGEPGAGRGREPLPRPGRDAGRRAARHRAGAAAGGRAGRQRLRLGQAARAVDHGRGA